MLQKRLPVRPDTLLSMLQKDWLDLPSAVSQGAEGMKRLQIRFLVPQ
jgi:hypothetical protein